MIVCSYLLWRLDWSDKCDTDAVRTLGDKSSGSGGAGGRQGDNGGSGGGGVTDLILSPETQTPEKEDTLGVPVWCGGAAVFGT